MQLHEYQAKDIFKKFEIVVPVGRVAVSSGECKEYFELLAKKCVIKAQIHSGGRGKAGGIKVVTSPQEAEDSGSQMLGSNLNTFQSAGGEFPVNKVYIEEALNVTNELYLAITMDFAMKCPVVILSTEGGMNIEEVAEKFPKKIIKLFVDPLIGLSPYKVRKLCSMLNMGKKLAEQLSSTIFKAYSIFDSLDCSLVEINPLAVVEKESIVALDAKITIEDDSMFRHKDLAKLFDESQMNESELNALKNDLSYIKLFEGQIGCMVNGAGLAMATMDITMKAGMAPANFLDVGGSASEDKIKEAYRIICSDEDVRLILVNLFGGILRCDVAAKGIVDGYKETRKKTPMIVVLRGTNSDEAKTILLNSDLDITFASDLPDAANKIRQKLGN